MKLENRYSGGAWLCSLVFHLLLLGLLAQTPWQRNLTDQIQTSYRLVDIEVLAELAQTQPVRQDDQFQQDQQRLDEMLAAMSSGQMPSLPERQISQGDPLDRERPLAPRRSQSFTRQPLDALTEDLEQAFVQDPFLAVPEARVLPLEDSTRIVVARGELEFPEDVPATGFLPELNPRQSKSMVYGTSRQVVGARPFQLDAKTWQVSPRHKKGTWQNELSSMLTPSDQSQSPYYQAPLEEITQWDDFLDVSIDTHHVSGKPGYYRLTLKPNQKSVELGSMSKDMLIALDASDSMSDVGFEQIRASLAAALTLLRTGDRFNILAFEADRIALNDGLWPVNASTLEAAQQFIQSLEPGGKTDIYRSLADVVRKLPPGNRPFLVLLISDGNPTVGVLDSRRIILYLTASNQLRASVHAVGVGSFSNRHLLDLLAFRNKGKTWSVTVPDQIDSTLQQALRELADPMLVDIQTDLAGFPGNEVFPRILPDLYRNSSLEVYGRFTDEKHLVVRLTGNVRGQLKDFVYRGNLPDEPQSHPEIMLFWARAKAAELVAQILESKEPEPLREELRQLVSEYNLQIPY